MRAWLRRQFDKRAARRTQVAEAKAAIKSNPQVAKRVLRTRRAAILRHLTLAAAFSGSVSGLTATYPDLVSVPLDDHAKAHGIEDGLQKHFATKNIRVYQRNNPLVAFDFAGRVFGYVWEQKSTYKDYALLPVYYGWGLYTGAKQVMSRHPLDAYAMTDNKPLSSRSCIIRPPGRVDDALLFKSFTGTHLTITNKGPRDEASERYYYALIMAHEGRHCDQDKLMSASALNEIDADIRADRIAYPLLPQDEAERARSYWAALRLVSAVSGHDIGHYSTAGLLRGGITPMQAVDDAAHVQRLAQVLSDGERMNREALGDIKDRIERRYHLARALLALPEAGDAHLRRKAAMFVEIVEYLDANAGNNLLSVKAEGFEGKLDMQWVDRDYDPVPKTPALSLKIAPKVG